MVPNGTYTRTNSFGESDDGCFPRFYKEPQLNHVATHSAGREIWEEVEMVEILMPGNLLTRPTAKVTDEHRQRWPKAYEAFKKEEDYAPEGRPIDEWPLLNRAQVKELKALGFNTVEQLGSMSEIAMQRIGMGARSIRDAAKAWVDENRALQPMAKLLHDKELLENQVGALTHANKEQGELLQRLSAQVQDLLGRPNGVAAVVPHTLDALATGGPAPALAPAASVSSLDRLANRRTPARPAATQAEDEALPAAKRKPAAKKAAADAAAW